MKKQADGRGSIVYEKDRKKYRAFFSSPSGRRISKRFETKKEAGGWLAEQQASVIQGAFIEPHKMTLGEWLITWMADYKKPAIRQTTYERYLSVMRRCESIADIPLQDLTAIRIQSFYNTLSREVSQCVCRKVHILLSSAIKKAYQLELIKKNIIQMVTPPKRQEKRSIGVFSQEELAAIISTAESHMSYRRHVPLIKLAIGTGARIGELLALRFCDIDRHKLQVHITRTIQRTKKAFVVNPPKTRAGSRIISISQSLADALPQGDGEELLFRTSKGTPFFLANLFRDWKNLLVLANVPYRNIHVLRHTHATLLLAAGVPVSEVARRLGHARISHTLDLYTHAIPTYDETIAKKIDNIFFDCSQKCTHL